MKNQAHKPRRLGNGSNKDLSWLFFKLSSYLAIIVVIGGAVVLALLYIFLWSIIGFWSIIALFAVVTATRWSVGKLVINPPGWVQHRPRLYKTILMLNSVLIWVTKTVEVLHRVQARAVMALGRRFLALPSKTKIIIAVAATLIFIPLSFFVTWKTIEVVRTRLPYGKQRFTMTAEQLVERKANRIKMAKFAVWGKDGAVNSAQCMEQYQSLIYAEARKNGITPERFEGLLFVEGFCNPSQINPKSGAAGMAQLMLDVGCEEGLVMDKGFCSEVLASNGKIKFIPKSKNIEDRRLEPQYAIPVAAKILGKAKAYWGDENWTFVEFHMGVGNLRKLVMSFFDEARLGWRRKYDADFSQVKDPNKAVPKEITKSGITYDDIFFRCTPTDTPKTYKLLFSLADSSATYVYTGLAATEGFTLMRTDKAAFLKMVAEQQDPDGGTANRPMRAWWSNKAAQLNTRSDIASAVSSGQLVAVQSNSSYGFILRTSGGDRIGQCDPGNESAYYFTRKATAGLIYIMASRTRELGGDPLEVTGLVRTNDMYDKPVRKNGQGCLPQTQPRTHVIGSAFDIGASINGRPMSKKTRDAWEFVIMDLRADGVIDRIKEGIADHIAYNPAFEKDLEDAYDRVVSGGSPLPANTPF